jgi:hypothetical protein
MKIAYSGTHGTGKTTKVSKLFNEIKIQEPKKSVGLLLENASFSPLPINKDTSELSQFWIFTNQMAEEIRLHNHYDILVTDRSIMDAIAYSKTMGYDSWKGMFEHAKYFMNTYNRIYYVSIENNDYWHNDGVRDADDLEYRRDVAKNLLELYLALLKRKDFTFKFEII